MHGVWFSLLARQIYFVGLYIPVSYIPDIFMPCEISLHPRVAPIRSIIIFFKQTS